MSSIVDRDEGDNSMGNEDIRGGRNPDASKLLSLCCACVKESVIGLGVPSAAGDEGVHRTVQLCGCVHWTVQL